MESFTVEGSHIRGSSGFLQVFHEVFQFLILSVTVPGENGNAIFNLVAERLDQVINDDHISEFSAFKDSKIFNKDTLGGLDAVFSVENVADILSFGIKDFHNSFNVPSVSRAEDDDFEFFAHLLDELISKRSDFEFEFGASDFSIMIIFILFSSYQSFIKVQDQSAVKLIGLLAQSDSLGKDQSLQG